MTEPADRIARVPGQPGDSVVRLEHPPPADTVEQRMRVLARYGRELSLTLEADDLDSLLHAFRAIEHDLLLKERDHDWTQPVEITSGGYDSGWHLEVTSDLTITGDAYRASLKTWSAADRAARNGANA